MGHNRIETFGRMVWVVVNLKKECRMENGEWSTDGGWRMEDD